jgi:hypothetical protein
VKTTLKYRSAAQAVRPSSSARGLLTLYFFIVLLCFLFKGGVKEVIIQVCGVIAVFCFEANLFF